MLDWLRFVSTEKRAFSVSWASWNRQKCPQIVLKFTKNLVLKFHFLLLGALSGCQQLDMSATWDTCTYSTTGLILFLQNCKSTLSHSSLYSNGQDCSLSLIVIVSWSVSYTSWQSWCFSEHWMIAPILPELTESHLILVCSLQVLTIWWRVDLYVSGHNGWKLSD